jgi:hypothetical protein
VGLLSETGAIPLSHVEWYRYSAWYERSYVPVYRHVCDDACTERLVPGEYRLALQKDTGNPVAVQERVVIRGPSILHAHYSDRSAVRTTGGIIAIAGTVGGVIMMVASVHREVACNPVSGACVASSVADGPLLATGIGVLVGATVAGSIMLVQHDAAHITVEPIAQSLLHASRESALLAGAGGATAHGSPVGAALTVRF